MVARLESRYGSCKGQVCFNGSYPKWFIGFLTGLYPRDAALDRSVREFLRALADRKWHVRIPSTVSIWTLQACVELGLVECLTELGGTDGYYSAKFRITEVGKKVLSRNKLLYSLRVN